MSLKTTTKAIMQRRIPLSKHIPIIPRNTRPGHNAVSWFWLDLAHDVSVAVTSLSRDSHDSHRHTQTLFKSIFYRRNELIVSWNVKKKRQHNSATVNAIITSKKQEKTSPCFPPLASGRWNQEQQQTWRSRRKPPFLPQKHKPLSNSEQKTLKNNKKT